MLDVAFKFVQRIVLQEHFMLVGFFGSFPFKKM